MKLALEYRNSLPATPAIILATAVMLFITACQMTPPTTSRRMPGEVDPVNNLVRAGRGDTALDQALVRYPTKPGQQSRLPAKPIVWEDVRHPSAVDPTPGTNTAARQTATPPIATDPTPPTAPAKTTAVSVAATEADLPDAKLAAANIVAPLEAPAAPDRAPARPMTRAELIEALTRQLEAEHVPQPLAALRLIALKVVDQNVGFDAKAHEKLSPEQQDFFDQLDRMLSDIAFEAGHTTRKFQPDSLVEQMQSLTGEKPLSIRTVELCTRVVSYGVYDLVENDAFLAGKEHAVIVYVELDHFKAVRQNDDRYRVRLSQEVTLCTEADGLPVWRHPRSEVLDESRNIRRDFFNVQVIRLPARLSVGKYRLKVSVTDHHGGTMDEAIIPISIVADSALVSTRRTDNRPLSNRN